VDRRANLDASYPAVYWNDFVWNIVYGISIYSIVTLIPVNPAIWNVSSGVLIAAVSLYAVFHVCDAMYTTM
jgi:hypothetical protein